MSTAHATHQVGLHRDVHWLEEPKDDLLLEVEHYKGRWSLAGQGSIFRLMNAVAGDRRGTFHGLGALDTSLRKVAKEGERLTVTKTGLKFVYADTGESLSVQEALYHYFGLPICVIAQPAAWYSRHRDYTAAGGAVAVAMYDDHLEIINTGTLHFDLTPKQLAQPHPSRPWNPIIAGVLDRAGIIEQWGTGTLQIIDWCRENANAAPIWEEQSGAVVVTIRPAPGFEEAVGQVNVAPNVANTCGGAVLSVTTFY